MRSTQSLGTLPLLVDLNNVKPYPYVKPSFEITPTTSTFFDAAQEKKLTLITEWINSFEETAYNCYTYWSSLTEEKKENNISFDSINETKGEQILRECKTLNKDFFRLVLNKQLKGNPSKYKCHEQLDKFIYNIGCITGWERKILESSKNPISYTCTTNNFENDREYFNKWIEEIKKSYMIEILNNTELLGEIIINFEES